ncbi:hypothetical protein ACP4OV_031203 [Aristida adscensionis]
MAFWGVEVKPAKPYTHSYQASHGRLRICQATLGNCDAGARTVLQCNVGSKIPIKLCSLNPKLAEMCHLEIELEEVDDVVFSVIGPSSVHLSGYYVGARSRCNVGDDESESYGEDIGQSDTDEEPDASEDSYESDFIDDRDVAAPDDNYGSDAMDDSDVECSSPRRHRKEAHEKPTRKVERRQRLKKYQVDSNDDKDDDSPYKPAVKRKTAAIFDSCSDDDVPISVALAKRNTAKAVEEITPNVQANDGTRKKTTDVKKRKSSAISQDPASPTDVIDAAASLISKEDAGIKKKSKKKLRNQLDAEGEKQSKIRTLEDGLIVEDLSTGNLDAKMASNGSKVSIKYVGTLKDGKIVESNINEKPYKFKLGSGKVIRGWNVGICGMRVGDKRRLTVPPSMCYGDKSVGEVPKNSSVIYEVELVKVK